MQAPLPPAAPPPAVIVTGARLPAPAADAAFSVTTVDPAALAHATELDGALRSVPGFSLYRRTSTLGANPTTQGVSLRGIAGSGASRALVVLDGVPQNDPFGGWVIWTALPPDDIGSARIVRGAGAGPYGAGALTGVVALQARGAVPGGLEADVSGGELGERRADVEAAAPLGPVRAALSLSGQADDGWIPVRAGRGAADRPLTLSAWSAAGRAEADIGPGVLATRLAAYDEERGSGVLDADSRSRGAQASATYAVQPAADAVGYRVQAWASASELMNSSASVSLDRNTATPANDQYAVPALGIGFNAAVRRATAAYSLELGADVRESSGESRELYSYAGDAFTRRRISGGQALVAGAYLEASRTAAPWLVTGGVRLDEWADFGAHRDDSLVSTGAAVLSVRPDDQSGLLPTARLGVRRDLAAAYLRAAAYTGFRPATLNELHRPFRQGNNDTEANAGLQPERLYGAEVGAGRDHGPLTWSATLFYNRLDDAITNLTIGQGPGTFPLAGFIPAGGIVRQRMNAGAVDAVGLEGEASRQIGPTLKLTAALDYTRSRVDGGDAAPQLTGLRPALTPRFTGTARAEWRPAPRLSLDLDLRYESVRYDDDLNTLRLGPAVVTDLRAEWAFDPRIAAYVAIDNLLDADIQTAQSANGVFSYDAPRLIRVGVRLRR